MFPDYTIINERIILTIMGLMDIDLLSQMLNEVKKEFEKAIRTSKFNGVQKKSGIDAKEALIRSQLLINRLHEVVKISIFEALNKKHMKYKSIHPEIGKSSPELNVSGLIKAKNQDVVILFEKMIAEQINEGPLNANIDNVGSEATKKSIIIGVRSQLSSVDNNFDTLMERTFAETLNLRLRFPILTMGEVYLLPVFEYDDTPMKENKVEFKSRATKIEKFIRTFSFISGREPIVDTNDIHNLYKYDRTALVLVNFKKRIPKIYITTKELIEDKLLLPDTTLDFDKISPLNFADDLINIYMQRFKQQTS